ncbi:MAG: glutamate synthase (NADPH), homotetrameric, partial [Bacteroidetes bacterium RIFCSPLOWO2_02_FULL_36_8]
MDTTQDNEYYHNERMAEWRDKLRKSLKSKERTKIERVKMPEEDPLVRNKSYVEVNKGLSVEQALLEAKRCLDCVDPTCITGCPVGINIPKFLKFVESGDFLSAAKVIKETNSLPAVCGRVCPQEIQCEAQCFYTIKLKSPSAAIGYLERFVADYERDSGKISIPEMMPENHIKVGIIGSGPAGLTVAGELAKFGYDVTVFEALHKLGGVLKYGIPDFRLPNMIADVEIETIRKMGVKFKTNFIVGKTATIDELKKQGFEAFFVGSGAGLPNFMNIPGENSVGVLSANEFLTRVNLMGGSKKDFDTPLYVGKQVAVIGGGNTAMDAVRTAKRLGAERAMIVYRRSRDEMPARKEEVHHALDEGIEFLNLYSPIKYNADEKGRVKNMILQKMVLGEPDKSGRRSPVPLAGSEEEVAVDMVIVAIGVSPNPLIPQSMPELEMTPRHTIKVDENMMTTVPGIFAGGDIV